MYNAPMCVEDLRALADSLKGIFPLSKKKKLLSSYYFSFSIKFTLEHRMNSGAINSSYSSKIVKFKTHIINTE